MNNELTMIENELVPVYETSTGEKVVYGTELHTVLEVKSRYREWIERRLKDCEAVENEDFQAAEISAASGQTVKQHTIKLDTAKEMAMLERNEKGKKVRRYFIKIEKKYKENTFENLSPELKAVIVMDRKIINIEKKIDQLENDIPLYGSEADEICNHVKRRGVEIIGGKQSNAYKDAKIRTAVYADIYSQIKREFGLYDEKGRPASYKALKRRYIGNAHRIIESYKLPTFLSEQVKYGNAQMNLTTA